MPLTSFFTEEGWTSLRNSSKRIFRYGKLCLVLAVCSSLAFLWFYSLPHLRPLQQLYLKKYLLSFALSKSPVRINTTYILLVRTVVDPNGKEVIIGVTDDQADPFRGDDGKPVRIGQRGNAYMFRLHPGIEHKGFYWQEVPMANSEMASWFATNIYHDLSFVGLFIQGAIFGVAVFIVCAITAFVIDYRVNREKTEGKKIRGTDGSSPEKFLRKNKQNTGVGIEVMRLERSA